jgi:Zc3h12a-like Ribonuclease NYN domain
MVVPALLFFVFAALTVFSQTSGQPDLLLLAFPASLAALFLLVRALRGRHRAAQQFIIVDGSNVLHWQDNRPQLDSLRAVLDRLVTLGYTPGVVFDANAGYKISSRYQHDHAMAKLLRLPTERILVAPKGTQADPLILASARDLGARIVTNDRYRDWAADYPEVESPGHLVGGGFRDGQLWLELEPAQDR